jgi:hypothetical protein
MTLNPNLLVRVSKIKPPRKPSIVPSIIFPASSKPMYLPFGYKLAMAMPLLTPE